MHFVLSKLRRHKDSVERTQLDYKLARLGPLAWVYQSLEHDPVDGRLHFHVFKINLRLPKRKCRLGEGFSSIGQGHLTLLQVQLRPHILSLQRRVAIDLPRLVPDLDPIGLDVIAVSLNGRLNQSIVASNEKVAFFHEIALLHWNLEDLSVELRR